MPNKSIHAIHSAEHDSDQNARRVIIIGGSDITLGTEPGQSEESILVHGEDATVPGSTLTTLINHTNTTKVGFLTRVSGTGQVSARYEVYVNDIKKITKRTSAAERNAEFDIFPGYRLEINDNVKVKVFHEEATTKQFEATLIGFK